MNGRSSKRFRTLRGRIALASAAVMVGTLIQGVTQPAAAVDDDKGRTDASWTEKPVPVSTAKVKPRPLMKGPRTPKTPPEAGWPEAATAVVQLPKVQDKTRKSAPTSVRAKGLPLTLDTQGKATKNPVTGAVETRVLSRAAAKKTGTDGLLFTLRSKSTTKDAQSGMVRAHLDYSDFAEAYGGGYASRLTLVQLPACAITTPEKRNCRTAEPVTTANDTEKQTLTAPDLALKPGAPTVLAAVAEAESGSGDYKATSLAPSATWDTNLNTGDFAWSYTMPVPDVPGSMTPNIGLSYSSGGVDGRTSNTNNQASWVGDGFDMWPGYIERRYKPCADDDVENADGNKPADLCWAYDNAFVSFNGKGGELVPDGTNSWRLRNDDGTKIVRLYGTSSDVRDNGARNDEYWRITTPDGTQYFFGYNRLPGWESGKETTDSTWTVPVFGDDDKDQCHASTFANSWCQQGWRWNLDYVVDPHGNAIAYYYDKETNSYGRNLKASDDTRYVRGGTVDRAEYGLKSSSVYSAKALGLVDFTNSERCLPNASTTCSSISTDAAYWYDTPWDLNCESGTECDDGRFSPSFFTRKRLTDVTTQVYDGTAYKNVDSWKLTHRWGQADIDYQLLLDSVQRTGHSADTAITLPKTTLAYSQYANRLDKSGDGYAPFIKGRLSTVADESGGQINVNYSEPACDWSALPTPQTNRTRCFPQYMGGSATEDPELQWFNKYVVDSVTATDRTGGAPNQVTTYDYLGGAAWHYDDDDGLTKEKSKTWSQWRGYGHVRVQTGGPGGASEMKSQQDTYFLRGMDGDRKEPSGGTKAVSATLGEGEGDPITDHEAAAGFAYKSVSYSGPNGKVLSKTVNRPWRHETAKKVRDWGTVTANFTGTEHTKTFTSLDDGAGATWRITSTATIFDETAGRVTHIDDFGDNSTSDDNRCTRTSYQLSSTQTSILTLPSRVETVAKSCGTTTSRPADVIADVRSAYDGRAYGEPPTKGDATASALLKKYDGTTAVYVESGATFDSYGRQLTSTDLTADVKVTATGLLTRTARSDGRTTTTERTPATGFATSTKVTTPPATAGVAATAHTSTTTHDIRRGLPLTQTDTNDKVTNFAYDALGRSSKVWLADRQTGQTPSYEFTYTIAEDKPVAVGTKTIGNGGAQHTAYALYDGFLRPRQTQEPGPDGGSLLTDVFYDERGLVSKEFATYYAEVAPSTGLAKPENALNVETQSHYTYDGSGRQTEAKQIAGNGDGGAVLSTARTIHGGDRTTVIPPVGGTATTTIVDARGQTTELRQHRTRSAVAAYDTTAYGYTTRGELLKVTDPDGNSWEYTYDLLGQQIKSVDPDKGTTISEYDDRGQLTKVDDARPDVPALWFGYDNLGRKTETREGSSTGTLRSKWVYDTLTGAKGHLAESTRYSGGNAYTSKVVAYDRLYRPLRSSITIPSSEGALQGTYLSTTSYAASGLVSGVGYPKAGSLSAATVAYTYEDVTLRPIAIDGSQGIKATTDYSLTGKPLNHQLSGGGKNILIDNAFEPGTQRLASTTAHRQDVAGFDKSSTYRYDEAGNVLSASDVSRSGTDTQCFTYDHLRRLTDAWTQGTTTCATAPSGSVLGGPAKYWHSYTYDAVGNRQTETLHDVTGDAAKDTKRTYAYPGVGKTRPHSLTSVTEAGPTGTALQSYGYDEVGNTTTRTIGGDTQSLLWDTEGHLAKVTEPVEGSADKVTEYVYDTDGNRLIGRTPTETTLYLGATEITLAKGTTTPKVTRYFDVGGGNQAVQKDDGSVSFTLADHHGTAELSIEAATQKLTQRRTLPFGGIRGDSPTGWPGTKGFVGGTDDTKVTGLTHLGAREYDPALGRFISVDPLLEIDKPQTLNGYTYGAQNPLFFTDATGLGLACGPGFAEGCGTGVVTRGDGTLSKNGSPTGGGTIYRPRTGVNGAPLNGPVTIKPYGKSVTIQGVYVPTQEELAAEFPYYHENMDYQGNLENWARSKCPASEASGDFCSAVGKLGWFGGTPEVDVLEVIGIRSYVDCYNGKGCTDAAVDASISAASYGAGKLAKITLNLFQAALKRSDSTAIGCLVKAAHSFVAGTEVLMADGTTKPIEDVEIGEKVTVTDPETGETTVREVAGTIVTEDDKHFVDLSFETTDGTDSLVTTTTHPFWSDSEDAWVEAGDLQPGMTVRAADGSRVPVVKVRDFAERQRTFDLTISDIHAYYVLAGEKPLLVHNSSFVCKDGPNGWPVPSMDNCLECAQKIREKIGGNIYRMTDSYGARLGPSKRDPRGSWHEHFLVIKDGKAYDGFTGPEGMGVDAYRRQWDYWEYIKLDHMPDLE
ncbi:polymorphic toxin-type HINT domain-containing protein [Streptomyces sp. CA-210063]|uniref:RHS repeat-associated core domain-containing protein n=1 Tax=Streptomyces sp. CA-210063 TaxID=2801029 RepID=UPI00214B6943|nr:RHS repeat-associated core domain-containing protein [Streptomyces sp. CA-210063]UUU31641.1 polymorphic toxin-type HINT domain-containing protein [Streptomyces sp. CA-210063]